MKIDSKLELQELLDIAKNTIKEVDSGEIVLVKDLFRGFEWNRIPIGFRTKLGSAFLIYAQYEGKEILEVLDKTPQNQQKYRKK